MKDDNRLDEIQKQVKIYRMAFIFLCIMTTFIIFFGRDVLKILGLVMDKIDDSLGDYISSLLGALIGVAVTMSGTIFLERKETLKQEQVKVDEKVKEEQEKKARKKADLRLLYFDLQMYFKELQENYLRDNLIASLKNDDFYVDMNEIFEIGEVNIFDKFLSNHERASIIIESELEEKSKIILLDFLSSSRLRFKEKSDYDNYKKEVLKLYYACKQSYGKAYDFIKPLDYLLELEGENSIFSTFRGEFNRYLGFYMTPFLTGDNEDEYGECCYTKEERVYHTFQIDGLQDFTIESFKEIIRDNKDSYLKINMFEEECELDYSTIEYVENYRKFREKNIDKISKSCLKHVDDIMKEISISEDFDDILRKIKNDYPDFAVVNGKDNFQKCLIDNEKKSDKLERLAFYISYTYSFSTSLTDIIKGKKYELPKNPIKYREKQYFNDPNVLELFDFSIAKTVISPSKFVEYLQTVNDLKYNLLPKLFDFMRPINAENLKDRYSSKEIEYICEIINEIKEKGEIVIKKDKNEK